MSLDDTKVNKKFNQDYNGLLNFWSQKEKSPSRISEMAIGVIRTDIINNTLEYIPTKTIEESQKTIVVPLNKTAKEILKKAGITRNVTWLNPLTGKEEKKPINELASSHMARRIFVGNLYKQVLDPNIVASMSGHAEGSRAFSRYREIDREIKTTAVNLVD